MVIVWEDVDVGPHVVDNHHEPLAQGIYRFTEEIMEFSYSLR
jgi:hypothetical protein